MLDEAIRALTAAKAKQESTDIILEEHRATIEHEIKKRKEAETKERSASQHQSSLAKEVAAITKQKDDLAKQVSTLQTNLMAEKNLRVQAEQRAHESVSLMHSRQLKY
jgi:hypothetical protein